MPKIKGTQFGIELESEKYHIFCNAEWGNKTTKVIADLKGVFEESVIEICKKFHADFEKTTLCYMEQDWVETLSPVFKRRTFAVECAKALGSMPRERK